MNHQLDAVSPINNLLVSAPEHVVHPHSASPLQDGMNSTVSPLVQAYLIAEIAIPIASLVLVVVTLPIYIIVVIVLAIGYYQPGQNNAFYRICMVGGIVDIIAIFVNYFLGILPAHGYYKELYLSSTLIGATYLALSWGIRYTQNCTATLLAVNRLMALVLPVQFRKVWSSDRFCYFAHFLQITIGVIFGSILYLSKYHYDENGLGGYYVMFSDDKFKKLYYNISGALASFFITYMLVNYIVILVHFKKIKLTVSSELMREKQKQEHRLLYIALSVCSMEVICYAFVVCSFLIKFEASSLLQLRPVRAFYLFYNVSTDLYSCTPPYLLIFFSTPFQRRLKLFLRIDCLFVPPVTHFETSLASLSNVKVEESRF